MRNIIVSILFLLFIPCHSFAISLPVTEGLVTDSSAILLMRDTLSVRSSIGLGLSIAGSSVCLTGIMLPIFAHKGLDDRPGAVLGSSLGLMFAGSTAACIGTSVIRKWGRDHVKAMPETKAWLIYKFGSAAMYSSFFLIMLGLPRGFLTYFGGEALMATSSIMSIIYCARIKNDVGKKRYQYYVYPIIKDGFYGISLIIS